MAQLEVVASLSEDDPTFSADLQLLRELNTRLYDAAPDDVRDAGQRLADLTAAGEATGEAADEYSARILAYYAETCGS